MSTRRFSSKAIVMTGATQGIGRGVAVAATEKGTHVLLVGRAEFIHEVQAEITAAGSHARAITVDLETYAGAQHAMQTALGAFGCIDVLINNAGGTIWAKPYQHHEEAQIEAETHRLLSPTLWCCRVVLPHMVERKQGMIVNVPSTVTRGIYRIPYSVAKGGVNVLTASLALEHVNDNIRVNAATTGGTEAPPCKIPCNATPVLEQETVQYQDIVDQTPASGLMHRYGTIDKRVQVILFLVSDEASYIAETVLPVGGGGLG